jgi:hypothetical protein
MACPSQVIVDTQFDQLEYVGDGLFSRVWRVENTDIAIKIPDEPGEAPRKGCLQKKGLSLRGYLRRNKNLSLTHVARSVICP